MSTGISIDENVVSEFNEFKLRSKYRYMILGLSEDSKSISILKTAPSEATYADFLADLPSNDCRYGILKFDYDAGNDGWRTKMVLFMWTPDKAKVKPKMIYAGTKDALKKALQGIQIEIQGTDASEVSEEEVLAKCKTISK
ncbi:uncharacterized protein LOC126324550 [Schistocerca gregaria]|uniref:uncharacterized protein LOC126324550 n=1 Tax=Schistocerca gregaria TaxID=7010 RepID=UPI00211DF5A2|nr:uncharacterized protein LOC126324550 [Schistocerca gregaria]